MRFSKEGDMSRIERFRRKLAFYFCRAMERRANERHRKAHEENMAIWLAMPLDERMKRMNADSPTGRRAQETGRNYAHWQACRQHYDERYTRR